MLTAGSRLDPPYDLPKHFTACACEDHYSTAHVITGSLKVQRLGYILIPYNTPTYIPVHWFVEWLFYHSESHAMPSSAHSVYAHLTCGLSLWNVAQYQ